MLDPVWKGKGIPHGVGRPTLLVCGFLAGDPSMTTMARWLKRIGHRPVRAQLRWNVGCRATSPTGSKSGPRSSPRSPGDG